MPESASATHIFRFEGLEIDLRAGELRRNGERIKLQEQPLQILRMLLERPGETVTREEIQKKLWPTDTFVEFDHSINAAIQRLRQAFGDSAENPRFVETVARRGYRFIAPVAPVSPPAETVAAVSDRRTAMRTSPLQKRAALAGAFVLAIAAVFFALNVAGLREGLLTAVGARRAVPLPKIESIAVLPLENLSGDPEQEYFADGMTEELISTLGKIGSLRVISRTSVMQFKGARPAGGLAEIAQKLNVDAVVEGSVMRSGDRVRVTAQLIQAHPEKHLWSESYERDLRDILALQSEVALAISGEIQAALTPQEKTRLASGARPVNPEAVDLYLKGKHVWISARGPSTWGEQYEQAIAYYQQAIDKDPSYAQAYVELAGAYNAAGEQGWLHYSEALPKAKAASTQALEIDDTLAEAHVALAFAVLELDWDWAMAERESERAIELNPNSAPARTSHADVLMRVGRLPEAIEEAKRAMEIDPLPGGRYNETLAYVYLFARQYDLAMEEMRKAQALNPMALGPFYSGWVYREKGMYKEAIEQLRTVGDNPYALGHLGNTYARAGNRAKAQEIIRKLKMHAAKQNHGCYEVALVYAGLGEKDRAFEWLEKAYQVRDKGMTFLKVDPALDPLRSDPRFQDLLRRMNFPP